MEKVVKISDIRNHIGELLYLKELHNMNKEYCKAIDDRVHAIEKMLEMVPKFDFHLGLKYDEGKSYFRIENRD